MNHTLLITMGLLSFLFGSCSKQSSQATETKPVILEGQFGSCCKDLEDAMTAPATSMFRVETNDVLFFSVGYVTTPQGTGWLDQAVIFCPFCGKQLQTREEIKRKSDARSK